MDHPTRPTRRRPAAPAPPASALTPEDLHRLTLFKWRYTFRGMGFDDVQVESLVFLTWLCVSQRVRG